MTTLLGTFVVIFVENMEGIVHAVPRVRYLAQVLPLTACSVVDLHFLTIAATNSALARTRDLDAFFVVSVPDFHCHRLAFGR